LNGEQRIEVDKISDLIERMLRGNPEGMQLRDISAEAGRLSELKVSDRTLKRRLSELVALKRVDRTGRGPATRYFVRTSGEADAAGVSRDSALRFSDDGEILRALVRQPLAARQPVGYNEAFIRDYRPGKSWYLGAEIRARLHATGSVIGADQPAGTFARNVLERFLIDLAWSSSRLEGNTYTRLDTQNFLEHGQTAEGKDAVETQMILNHKRAIEMLVDRAEGIGFNRYTLLNLHAALSENLLGDSRDEGQLRTRIVGVTGTTYTPLSIPQKLEELFDVLLHTAAAIDDPFEQALFAMVHIPYLQPFADVNKRTSRLAANIPLIRANLCPLSFLDVPESDYIEATIAVSELNRVEPLRDLFVWAYERSAKQYRVVRDSVPQPDRIRLRYREQLTRIVQSVVRSGQPATHRSIALSAKDEAIPDGDRTAVEDAALSALLDLHEGSIARYGLRPSELTQWTAASSTR